MYSCMYLFLDESGSLLMKFTKDGSQNVSDTVKLGLIHL